MTGKFTIKSFMDCEDNTSQKRRKFVKIAFQEIGKS